MNTTATPAPPKTKTKTIKIGLQGIPKVTEHITRYKNDETITFVSDKHASLAFDNYAVFNMDGVQLEADVPIELTPNYPQKTDFRVSDVTIKKTGLRSLTRVEFTTDPKVLGDPPKIVPGS